MPTPSQIISTALSSDKIENYNLKKFKVATYRNIKLYLKITEKQKWPTFVDAFCVGIAEHVEVKWRVTFILDQLQFFHDTHFTYVSSAPPARHYNITYYTMFILFAHITHCNSSLSLMVLMFLMNIWAYIQVFICTDEEHQFGPAVQTTEAFTEL